MPEKTIGAMLGEIAQVYARRPAVTDGQRRYSYRELQESADALAKGLLSAGVEQGTHVGVWAEAKADTLLWFYALWEIGAVVVPICTNDTERELLECVENADIAYLAISAEAAEQKCGRVSADFFARSRLFLTTDGEKMARLRAQGALIEEETLLRAKAAVTPRSFDSILFTSGTLQGARPVLTTHASRVSLMLAQARVIRANSSDVFCSALPLHHCFSLTATVLAAMCAGACVCIPADRHGSTILKTVEREKCTVLSAVPTLFSVLLRRAREERYDLGSLRIGLIGGSAYPPQFYRTLSRELRYTILPSLGQTEATAAITAMTEADPIALRAVSVGRFLPEIEGCIKTADGRIASSGTQGEICVRGCGVMAGYYRRREATREAIDADGWLHTGDLGRMDAQGYVYYTGRLKELIIRGGENISPGEIEAILLSDRRIRAAKAIGLPDAHYTEEVCVCVETEAPLDGEEIRRIVRRQAAPYKVPRYVLTLERLPVTSTGKIDARALRALAEETCLQHTDKKAEKENET